MSEEEQRLDPLGLFNLDATDLAAAERDAEEEITGRRWWSDLPPGSIGWLEARGICCECGFARGTRRMLDPTCSPPLIYCERCIREINECRESNDESELVDVCPSCGGDGRYDDAVECSTCDGSGYVD